jgi:hypothetical protein
MHEICGQRLLFVQGEIQELCRRMAVESFSFLFVSWDLVKFFGNARIAFIAGLFVVDAEAAGVAQRAILLADRLALIVCNIILAHTYGPVFHAAPSKCGLSRLSDAIAKIVWRAHATISSARMHSMVDAAFFALGSILIFAKMTTKAHFNSSD